MFKEKVLFGFAILFIACNDKLPTTAKPASEIPGVLYPALGQNVEALGENLDEWKRYAPKQQQESEILAGFNADEAEAMNKTRREYEEVYIRQSLDETRMSSEDAPEGDEENLERLLNDMSKQAEDEPSRGYDIEATDSDGKVIGKCVFPYTWYRLQHHTCFVLPSGSVPLCGLTDSIDRDGIAGFCKAVHVRLRSEGCAASVKEAPAEFGCGWGFMYVNGKDVSLHKRGHNLAVLDAVNGKVEQVVSFDTHGDSQASTKLRDFLKNLPERKIVLMVIQDEGSMFIYSATDEIKRIFGKWSFVPYRGSQAGIGYTGPETDVPWKFLQSGRLRSSAVDTVTDIPIQGVSEELIEWAKEEKAKATQAPPAVKSLKVHLESQRSGCKIQVNGEDLTEDKPGTHVVILDYKTGDVVHKGVFDTTVRSEGAALRRLLRATAQESIVMVAAQGDTLDYLSLASRYLKELGSKRPPVQSGGNYVFLGYKGQDELKDWVQTHITDYEGGPATIDAVIEITHVPETTQPLTTAPAVITNQPTTAASVITNPPTGTQPKPPVNPLPGSGKCGWRQIHTYVIGGENSRRGEWPWQIGMYVNGDFNCGGSLISDRWIVTAAHCVHDYLSVEDYSIVLGDFDRKTDEGTEKTYKVSQIIANSEFDYDFLNKDIAVMELAKPVEFNRYIQPICLAEADEELPVGSKCYITGWGSYKYMSEGHQFLQKALLPPVSEESCAEKLLKSPVGGMYNITENMLCAGVENTILSGCHGDSGGPYVCQMEDGHWVLHGAVSWGSAKCDAAENFSVFAKISALRDWIDKSIGYEDEDED